MDPPQDGGNDEAGHRGRIEAAVPLAVFVLLVIGCFVVLKPFLTAILWAVLLCFSTWGLYGRLKRLLGHRKSLAALTMTLALAAIAVVPFVIVGASLADNMKAVAVAIRHAIENGPKAPPRWVVDAPIIGPHLHDYLASLAHDRNARMAAAQSLIEPVRGFAVRLAKGLGHGILEISLSLLICFFLYRDGDMMAARLKNMAFRIAGDRGRHLLDVASLTVRGVVHGIIGTSLIQGVLGGIGLWIAGVPGAFFLGFTTFLLAFVPTGPALIWLPAAGWLYQQGFTVWAIFTIVWGVVAVGGVDHFIKPIIISRSSSTPLILVMLGVFGGALAFGFIGVFIGPTLLAVGYGMVDEWSEQLAV
jgi:predicted PurR-regulated permease PerM